MSKIQYICTGQVLLRRCNRKGKWYVRTAAVGELIQTKALRTVGNARCIPPILSILVLVTSGQGWSPAPPCLVDWVERPGMVLPMVIE